MAVEGEFPKSDGDILFGSEVNSFNNIESALAGGEITTFSELGDSTYDATSALFAVSSTVFIRLTGSGSDTTKRGTLSSGVITWTFVDDQVSTPAQGAMADDDGTDIIISNSTGDASFSTDGGQNFTGATTNLVSANPVKDMHYVTGGAFAVAVGDGSAGGTNIGAWYTTNGGVDWTQATSGAGHFVAVSMFSTTVGFAVDDSGNVYKTTNGAVDWTDTTTNVNANVTRMLALTTSTFITVATDIIHTGDDAGNSNQRTRFGRGGRASNILKATNGNLYIIVGPLTSSSVISIIKSTDGGITWSIKIIGAQSSSSVDYTSTNQYTYLTEYDTNKLAFCVDQQIYVIDESYR